MKAHFTFALTGLLMAQSIRSQNFLNGDFENNTAVVDQINVSNAAFNGFMANTIAFGPSGNMDIIQSNTYCGFRQSGCWYIGFTGLANDAISMRLSAPLVAGTTYNISFWEKACTPFSCGPLPMEIGLSTVNNAFGTNIFTSPLSISGVWTQRTFAFVAPNNGQFITVRMTAGTGCNWVQMDNFSFPPFNTSIVCSPMPIELTSFEAKAVNNSVELNWRTATELNNDFFTLERSRDGIEFETVSVVNGAGNSTRSIDYSETDISPYSGTSYYRLKQSNFDKTYTYSEIRSVKMEEKRVRLNFYPNPVQGDLYVTSEQDVNADVISILDSRGAEISVTKVNINEKMVKISGLISGMYFFVYTDGKFKTSQKLIVDLKD